MSLTSSKSLMIYSLATLVSTIFIIHHEFTHHKRFYPSTLALMNDPLNMLIMTNFLLWLIHLMGILFVKFYFGELWNLEIQYVYDVVTKKMLSIILIIYFTGMNFGDFLSLVYIAIMLLALTVHKLLFKRADYITSIPSKNKWEYVKLAILFSYLFLIDCLLVNYLSDLSPLFTLTIKKTVKSLHYIGIIVSLDILSMGIALGMNFIKFQINSYEVYSEQQFVTKSIVFNILDIVIQVSNLLIQILLSIFTITHTNMYPIYSIAPLISSIY
jgi:hypothetical protein